MKNMRAGSSGIVEMIRVGKWKGFENKTGLTMKQVHVQRHGHPMGVHASRLCSGYRGADAGVLLCIW